MLSPDEIIEIGFSNLRRELSSVGPEDLVAVDRRKATVAKVRFLVVGLAGCSVSALIVAVALKPVSAFAALAESARLTSAQPVIHMHIVNHDTYEHPSNPPERDLLPVDIWRFSDHYIRKEGHLVKVLFKDGRYLAYDDRFRDGFSWKYDASKDPTWTFDGTIGPELDRRHPFPVTKREEQGATVFEWSHRDAQQNGMTERIYVDPKTKLIHFAEGSLKDSTGRRNHGTDIIEYPSADIAARQAEGFPPDLRFRSKGELLDDFNRRIGVPDQTKTLEGIQVTLYGVNVFPNMQDGIGIEAITRGSGGHKCGPGHPVQIADADLFPQKRSDLSAEYHDPSRAEFSRIIGVNGKLYISSESNVLLSKAPTQVTIRVPVWRSDSEKEQFGVPMSAQHFVGYVTFTTSKLFFNVGCGDLPFYGDPRAQD